MKCWEVGKERVVEGITLRDGFIVLGEEGRGRRQVRVPLPHGIVVKSDRVFEVPTETDGALVLIHDQSGYRGSWTLAEAWSDETWDRIAARLRGHRPPDGNGRTAEGHAIFGNCGACDILFGPLPERREPKITVVAEGRCAQGIGGYMGGGPEVLIVLRKGQAVECVRSGRLYGLPGTVRISFDGEKVTLSDPLAAAMERAAAAALRNL